MKIKFHFIIICLSILCGISCSKSYMKKNFEKSEPIFERKFLTKDIAKELSDNTSDNSFSSAETTDDAIERKLIKDGHINFETNNIEDSRKIIQTLLKKYRAYISFENESKGCNRLNQELTIKIPKDNFEMFFDELVGEIKKVNEKRINVKDVTEEFIDINARLRIKKEAEAGYLKLLNQAKNIKDILDIQNQIQILRSEIESIEGRLRYLDNAVNFSVLNIFMYQNIKNENTKFSFFEEVWTALKEGVKNFAEVFITLLYGWVFILIFAILIMVVILKIKKIKGNKNDN